MAIHSTVASHAFYLSTKIDTKGGSTTDVHELNPTMSTYQRLEGMPSKSQGNGCKEIRQD